jgi:ABC-2 type transport system permease protein
VITSFVFLLSRSFANRTKARLKRLKQPKYLIGGIFGLLYLYGYFFQFLFSRGRTNQELFANASDLFSSIGSVALFLLAVSAWIFPHERAALVFSEAEIAFLFPAPVSRRALVHYKLLKSQVAILFTVLLLTLITGRIFASSHAWMRVLGWWVILSTLGLHFLGASFARTMLMERGISNWRRRLAVVLGLAAFIALAVFWTRETIVPPDIENFTDWSAWRAYLQQLVATPPLSYLLFPFRLVLAPYLAHTPMEFARAFLCAFGIILLHYVWVVRSNVAFEEASLDLSKRYAEKIAAARTGKALDSQPKKGSRAPFRLAATGYAPIALLWKNLIGAQASFRGKTILILIGPLIFMAIMMTATNRHGSFFLGAATMIAFMCYIWSFFLGPQMVRCDFRRDLAAMDVLKLLPLRGWQIAAGELLAPTAILTVIQWLLLIVLSVLTTAGKSTSSLPALPPYWISWISVAALLTPLWNAVTLVVPNAAVLLFPGWFQTRLDAPQGIEVTGQRLLLFFGQLIVIVISAIPAALAFTAGFLPLHLAGLAAIAPFAGAAGAAVILAGEIALGLWLLGKLFDRFDLATEQAG